MKAVFVLVLLLSSFARAADAPSPLSVDDQRVLAIGSISHGRYITGGVIGSVIGFGLGHTIQGRYRYGGWIFTAGDGVSLLFLAAGTARCMNHEYGGRQKCDDEANGWTRIGAIGMIGFHIWEIIDVWVTPPKINRRYEELEREGRVTMQVAPVLLSDATPGLGLRLTF